MKKRIIRIIALSTALVFALLALSACGTVRSSSKTYSATYSVDPNNVFLAGVKSMKHSYTFNESGSYRLVTTVVKTDGKTESTVTESGTYIVREQDGKSKITFNYYEGDESMSHTYSYEETDWYVEINGDRYTLE